MRNVKRLTTVCVMLLCVCMQTKAQILVYPPNYNGGGNSGLQGTYVKPWTPSKPSEFKPDMIGVSPNGIVTVNGVERPDLMQNGAPQNNSYDNGNSLSQNSSSSSSGTAKICSKCHGSGVCRTCNGKLYYIPYVGASPVRCSICGQTGKCTLCNGTGKFGTYRGY